MLEGGEVCGKKTIKSRPPTPPGGGMAAAPEGQRGRPMRPPSCVGGVGIRAAIVAAYALAARAANLNRCGVIQAKQARNKCKESDQCGRPPASVVGYNSTAASRPDRSRNAARIVCSSSGVNVARLPLMALPLMRCVSQARERPK